MKLPQLKLNQKVPMDKDSSRLLTVVAVATVISVFCLVSSKALLSQASYQRRLLNARHKTAAQLRQDKSAADTLANQYNAVFENSGPSNVIGGKNDNSTTAAPPDGDNARIVIDALPTSYDFPALISSVSKILSNDGIGSPSITGNDDSANADNQPSPNPQPVPITFIIGGSGSYANVQKLIADLERSIRPFDVTNLQINGVSSSMSFSLNATTYYQPAKSLTIGTKEIR